MVKQRWAMRVNMEVKTYDKRSTKREIKDRLARALHGVGFKIVRIKFPTDPSICAKGSDWERTFAKRLSRWYSDNQDEYIFERRAGSGGSKRDKNAFSGEGGDIFAVKAVGKNFTNKFIMELKFYKDLTSEFWRLFTNDNCPKMEAWWKKVSEEGRQYDRHAILIIRINRKKSICITNAVKYFQVLDSWSTIFYTDLAHEHVAVFPLEDWFETLRPGDNEL